MVIQDYQYFCWLGVLNIRIPFYQYRDSHYKDTAVSQLSLLYNGNHNTQERQSLYWYWAQMAPLKLADGIHSITSLQVLSISEIHDPMLLVYFKWPRYCVPCNSLNTITLFVPKYVSFKWTAVVWFIVFFVQYNLSTKTSSRGGLKCEVVSHWR